MFGLLGRYLLGQIMRGVAVALAVVVVLILLVDFVEQTRTVDVRIEGVTLLDYAGLTLLKTPMLVETTLPFIVLFGVMLTMFQLNRRSELVVMRASGVSAWRFVTPALFLAVVIGVLSPVLLNPFATSMVQRFEDARSLVTGGMDTRERSGAAWYREAGGGELRLIRADAVDPPALTLYDATFLFFTDVEGQEPVFERRVDAETAVYTRTGWRLEAAVEYLPGETPQPLPSFTVPAYLDVAALSQDANAESISFWRLPSAASAALEVGVSPTPYRLRWLRLLMTPLLFVAMVLIASAASLRLMRLGGALQLGLLGGLAGFGLYFLGNMLDAFALGGRLPPILAASAAPMVATLAALAVIAHFEDG